MKFDREALSDCFNSLSLANEIRRQFQLGCESAPLEDIASAVGIFNIREEKLNSIAGALVVPPGKYEGEILLNSDQYPERKRFTLAHEIGHFVHPKHHPEKDGRFNCSAKDIFQSYKREEFPDIENQANEFASELLISKNSIEKLVRLGTDLDLNDVVDFCENLQVSKAFAVRKFQPVATSKIAFIFSQDGVVRYTHSEGFPFMRLWSRDKLPSNSSSVLDVSDNTILKKNKIDSIHWLKRSDDSTLHEQTYVQENGYRITMLILE